MVFVNDETRSLVIPRTKPSTFLHVSKASLALVDVISHLIYPQFRYYDSGINQRLTVSLPSNVDSFSHPVVPKVNEPRMLLFEEITPPRPYQCRRQQTSFRRFFEFWQKLRLLVHQNRPYFGVPDIPRIYR